MNITVHLGATNPNSRPGNRLLRPKPQHAVPIRSCSRWGLQCHTHCWLCGGLLPRLFTLTRHAGRFVFCCTFPGVAPAGCYPAPCFLGARTFLSALKRGPERPSSQLVRYSCREKRKRSITHQGWHSSPLPFSPDDNTALTPDSSAWRNDQHCISGSFRRSFRHRDGGLQPDISYRP